MDYYFNNDEKTIFYIVKKSNHFMVNDIFDANLINIDSKIITFLQDMKKPANFKKYKQKFILFNHDPFMFCEIVNGKKNGIQVRFDTDKRKIYFKLWKNNKELYSTTTDYENVSQEYALNNSGIDNEIFKLYCKSKNTDYLNGISGNYKILLTTICFMCIRNKIGNVKKCKEILDYYSDNIMYNIPNTIKVIKDYASNDGIQILFEESMYPYYYDIKKSKVTDTGYTPQHALQSYITGMIEDGYIKKVNSVFRLTPDHNISKIIKYFDEMCIFAFEPCFLKRDYLGYKIKVYLDRGSLAVISNVSKMDTFTPSDMYDLLIIGHIKKEYLPGKKDKYENNQQNKPKDNVPEKVQQEKDCLDLLKKHNIKTNSEYKKYSLKHHPDKYEAKDDDDKQRNNKLYTDISSCKYLLK